MEDNNAEALRKTLAEIFERLMLSFEVDDDGDFYINEGLAFPGWVYVIQDGALIKIWSYLAFKDEENVDTQAADSLANRVNQEYLPNVVYHKNGRLYFQYFYPSKFDFNEKQFVNMLRRCFESFVASIRACDDDDLLP